MARHKAVIAMAVAIPATVAFTAVQLPEPAQAEPHPWNPAQPVVTITPVAGPPSAPAGRPPAPAVVPLPAPAVVPPPDRDVGSIVVNAALTKVGAPYAWGGTGPDAFDCSGLVVWAFRQAGVALPRSSQALASGGEPVPVQAMQPGDVISLFPDASHVGIYVGGGRMIHAQFEGEPVIVESLYGAPIHNVRRYAR